MSAIITSWKRFKDRHEDHLESRTNVSLSNELEALNRLIEKIDNSSHDESTKIKISIVETELISTINKIENQSKNKYNITLLDKLNEMQKSIYHYNDYGGYKPKR